MSFKRLQHSGGINKQGQSIGWIDAVLLIGVCINMALMLYFVLVSYRYDFHSDAAAANLLAQEIYESGNFFPRDWQYVNGDLWVIFMQAWLIPIVAITKNGYLAHAMAGVIGCVLILTGTWCITAIMQLSLRARLIALIVLTSGLSPNFSENIFGQQAYGVLFFIACFILYGAWRFLQVQGARRWIWALAYCVLVTLATMSNPQRAAVYFLLPTLAGAFAIGLPRQGNSAAPFGLVHLGLLAGLTILAAGAGAMLHGYFMALGHSSLLPMPVVWIGFDAMLVNAMGAIRGLISLLVGLPTPGTPMASPTSALMALRLLAAVTIIVLAPKMTLRFLASAHPGRQFVTAAAATSLALTLFVFVTSTLALPTDPESSIRYVVPGLVFVLLVLIGVAIDATGPKSVLRWAAVSALAVLAFSAPFAYQLQLPAPPPTAAGVHPDSVTPNANVRLAHFLQAQGLRYGYATFWIAGRTTVLSDGMVKVRQILPNNGALTPYRHLSAEHWYEPAAWRGRTFLLLTADEAKTIKWESLFKITGKPQQQLTFENYIVTTFDHNIALDFPEWRVSLTEPARYIASELTPHTVGTFTDAPPALTAQKGEAGVLRFGPYQRLVPGSYRIRFDIRTEGEGVTDFGRVDVAAAGGNVLVGTQVTAPGAQQITLQFNAKELLRDVEFRVIPSGNGKFTFYQAELSNEQSH